MGPPVWLDNVAKVVQWQGQAAVQVTVFDITEQKQAEAALAAQITRYQMLADRKFKKHFSAGPSGAQPPKTPLGPPSVARWRPPLARGAGGFPGTRRRPCRHGA